VSHAPLHAVLQQYPLAQLPLAQSRQPATRQSAPALWLHALAMTFCGTQALLALQYSPAAQYASDAQCADPGLGHVGSVPSHAYCAHGGVPGLPSGATSQVPSAPGRLQRSHAPAHTVLQQ
jgi:hypothetical protein